ncbi:MAG TPA: FkbM family methyltransferase [Candidatus Nitrosopolaris sp.]|nr:FkbM family methyltransferase [Candidatus Nitrosopolaris sp.]
MGKDKRDKFLRQNRISAFDFLPERIYLTDSGVKAIPRRKTRDFQMLFISREQEVRQYLVMEENETFVDVGANVGSYSLMVANEYKDRAVKVIAIEAHPENYRALRRNIQCNKFENVIIPINKAVSNYKGLVELYERSHDGTRVDSEMFSVCNDQCIDAHNILHPGGNSLRIECDTLDNILLNYRVDVVKMDVEGAEVLALKAATKTLEKIRKIVVEIHGDKFEDVKQVLTTHGFKVESINEKGQMSYITGSK